MEMVFMPATMTGIVVLYALCIGGSARIISRHPRPYPLAWCYRRLRQGMSLSTSLLMCLYIVAGNDIAFLPLTFFGPTEMRHMAAWFGGTGVLLTLALYGLRSWNGHLMARVASGVRLDEHGKPY